MRLSYEKITDVFTSNKPQTLIHLTLDNGEQLTATEGHPFKTVAGWRDAVLLKKGGQLLLKGGNSDAERLATIVEISSEQKTLPVFNLEVANAHTFFVGEEGVLVHNSACDITKHTINRHVNRSKYPDKSKFKDPSQLQKNTDRTVRDPDRVINQGDRVRYERDFPRDVGTKGERTQVVVKETGSNKVVTTFPTKR